MLNLRIIVFLALACCSLTASADTMRKSETGECALFGILDASVELLPVQSVGVAPWHGITGKSYHSTLDTCEGEGCPEGVYSAIFPIKIAIERNFHVAVDQMVWIDLYNTAGKVEGLTCEKTGCPPIRKLLLYRLKPGTHWLKLSTKAPTKLRFSIVPEQNNRSESWLK